MQAGASGSRAFRSRAALPSEWDRRHYGRQQHVQDYLKVDGLTVKYVGPGESDSQAATLFADKPVPQDVPLYYFEVTIVNKGDSGYIGIGFCADSVNLGRLPGWEPHSYGYHGDDGHAFHGSGHGRPFGPGFTTGDVVGALLDRSRKTISYYKNGEFVGIAFYDVQEHQLYPCVGMRTKHEEVRANFGGAPFCVDLNRLHAEFKERVLADITAIQLPVTVDVTMHPPSSRAAAAAAAGSSSSSAEVEAAAAACTQAIRALDSSSSGSAALADLESATQAYLAALEAAALAGDAEVGAFAAAAAACSSGMAGAEAAGGLAGPAAAAGKANQPLLLYYVFNYLLHRRCWKTAAIIAREMAAVSSSSSGRGPAAAAAADGPAAGDAAAMECSVSAAAAEDHPMPDAAGSAAAAEQPSSSPAAAPSTSGTPAAAAAAGAFSEADVQDALRRQKIYSAVCAGHVADALAVVKVQYGPAVLEQHPRLHFKLRVQHFVELVRQAGEAAAQEPQQPQQQQQGGSQASNGAAAGACVGSSSSSSSGFEAALAYGRAELGPGSKSEADEELLSDALSLLAYADPTASPCGHLLRESYRAELAEELNGALLQARGGSGQPLLECAYRQAVVLVDELKRNSLPAALVLDVPSICCGSSSSRS